MGKQDPCSHLHSSLCTQSEAFSLGKLRSIPSFGIVSDMTERANALRLGGILQRCTGSCAANRAAYLTPSFFIGVIPFSDCTHCSCFFLNALPLQLFSRGYFLPIGI